MRAAVSACRRGPGAFVHASARYGQHRSPRRSPPQFHPRLGLNLPHAWLAALREGLVVGRSKTDHPRSKASAVKQGWRRNRVQAIGTANEPNGASRRAGRSTSLQQVSHHLEPASRRAIWRLEWLRAQRPARLHSVLFAAFRVGLVLRRGVISNRLELALDLRAREGRETGAADGMGGEARIG